MKNLTDIEQLHKYSFKNKSTIQNSKECWCFYCQSIFSSSDINERVDNWWETALCPKCVIDSVIWDSIADINKELLSKMNKRRF